MRHAISCALAVAMLAGCAAAPERPALSSYGCMAAVRDSLPPGLDDKRAHCLAAGGIAQRCSALEADLAGIGKELRDAFTRGDPSWADWRADRAGIGCARRIRGGEGMAACCAAAGY
jgi:hypothetical protein